MRSAPLQRGAGWRAASYCIHLARLKRGGRSALTFRYDGGHFDFSPPLGRALGDCSHRALSRLLRRLEAILHRYQEDDAVSRDQIGGDQIKFEQQALFATPAGLGGTDLLGRFRTSWPCWSCPVIREKRLS